MLKSVSLILLLSVMIALVRSEDPAVAPTEPAPVAAADPAPVSVLRKCYVCNSIDDASCAGENGKFAANDKHKKDCTNGESFCRIITQNSKLILINKVCTNFWYNKSISFMNSWWRKVNNSSMRQRVVQTKLRRLLQDSRQVNPERVHMQLRRLL